MITGWLCVCVNKINDSYKYDSYADALMLIYNKLYESMLYDE
jgi:hypothetical protein